MSISNIHFLITSRITVSLMFPVSGCKNQPHEIVYSVQVLLVHPAILRRSFKVTFSNNFKISSTKQEISLLQALPIKKDDLVKCDFVK